MGGEEGLIWEKLSEKGVITIKIHCIKFLKDYLKYYVFIKNNKDRQVYYSSQAEIKK